MISKKRGGDEPPPRFSLLLIEAAIKVIIANAAFNTC